MWRLRLSAFLLLFVSDAVIQVRSCVHTLDYNIGRTGLQSCSIFRVLHSLPSTIYIMLKVKLERRRRVRNFEDVFDTNMLMNALFIDTAITIPRNGTYTPWQQEILPFEVAAPTQIQVFCVLFAPEAQENFQFSSSDCSTETLFYGV